MGKKHMNLEWTDKGIEFYDQGKFDEALKCFEKAIEIDPHNAGTWRNKGHVLVGLEKYDEAAEAFDEAIKLNPENANIWYDKALALETQGKRDEAILAYGKALELNPAMPKPAALMDVSRFKSVSEWFEAARAEGLRFPLAMPQGLGAGMNELKLSFPETFNLFVQKRIIVPIGNSYIYVLREHEALNTEIGQKN